MSSLTLALVRGWPEDRRKGVRYKLQRPEKATANVRCCVDSALPIINQMLDRITFGKALYSSRLMTCTPITPARHSSSNMPYENRIINFTALPIYRHPVCMNRKVFIPWWKASYNKSVPLLPELPNKLHEGADGIAARVTPVPEIPAEDTSSPTSTTQQIKEVDDRSNENESFLRGYVSWARHCLNTLRMRFTAYTSLQPDEPSNFTIFNMCRNVFISGGTFSISSNQSRCPHCEKILRLQYFQIAVLF